jgi:glycosyltransferase involved in cell wall biosynthesis
MGEAGRARVLREFTWAAIARRVVELYASLRRDPPR